MPDPAPISPCQATAPNWPEAVQGETVYHAPASLPSSSSPKEVEGAGATLLDGRTKKAAPTCQLAGWQDGGGTFLRVGTVSSYLCQLLLLAATDCHLIACPLPKQGRGQTVSEWTPPRAEVAPD